MQASLGLISPNFREVSITLVDGVPTIDVTLERNDAEDLEEISELKGEFAALLWPEQTEFECRVHISNEHPVRKYNGNAITFYTYKRREDMYE